MIIDIDILKRLLKILKLFFFDNQKINKIENKRG